MSKKYLNDVVQILKSKKGVIYIKITENGEDFKNFINNVKPGDPIFCESQEDSLKKALEAGRISEDKYADLLEKTSFVKYKGTFSYDD